MKKALICLVLLLVSPHCSISTNSQVWASDLETCFRQAAIDATGPLGNLNLLKWARSLAECTSGMPIEEESPSRVVGPMSREDANRFMRVRWDKGQDWKPWRLRTQFDGEGNISAEWLWLKLKSRFEPEDVDEMMEE